jgi:HAD domain in Swiss Army Knife RNA repair proteins
MKFLYTDIDYVLSLASEINYKQTKWGLIHRFNPKAVSVYNEILTKTGAKIIVSSDWRNSHSLEELGYIFTEWAGIIKRPFGVTTTYKTNMQRLDEFRAKEILEHVAEFKPDAWIAIDDLYLTPWIPDEHFVFITRIYEGIKQSGKKEQIINKLNINDNI